MKVVEFEEQDVAQSMLLVGFPSRGFVGTVAVEYVIRNLGLKAFAGVYGAQMPPTMIGRAGVAYSPIRLYTGRAQCGPDGKCDKLVAAVGDIPLDPPGVTAACRAIVAWAKERGVEVIVILEGIDAPKANGGPAKRGRVWGLRSVTSRLDLAKFGITAIPEAAVSSYAAALLLAANEAKLDAIGLFVDAKPDLPDARASGLLLRSVDPMIPKISLDPKPLEKQAAALERALMKSMKDAAKQLQSMRKSSDMMYM